MQIMEHDSSVKKKEVLTQATAQMMLEDILLSETAHPRETDTALTH